MPVRFTNRGAFLLHYDKGLEKWRSERCLSLSWLKQPVSAEPGTTVGDILNAVAASPDVSSFLTEYTGCNTDELNARDRSPTGPIVMPTGFEETDSGARVTGEIETTILAFWCEVELYESEDEDGRHVDKVWSAVASHKDHPDAGIGFGFTAGDKFGSICALEVAIDHSARFRIHNHGVIRDDLVPTTCTVFDFLDALYSLFGRPKYDDRDQRDVEAHEDIVKRARELMGMDDLDAADWWKEETSEDE